MINQNSEMLNKLFFTELQMLVEKYNKIDEVTKKKIESIITRLKDKELQSYLMNNPNKLLELVKNIDEIDEEVVIFFTWYNLEIKTIVIHKAKECTEELRVNKNKGTEVCNLNSIKAEVVDEVVVNNLIEIVNNELLLKKVINNINKNKSSKLKPKLDEMNLVNKEIDKLNGKKNSSMELFEDGILTKNELAEGVKKLNEEIDILKFRLDELKQDVILVEVVPVPFELVSQVMKKFGQVFKESSTRQQRKQLLNLLVSKVTIDKSREIDTIELQINEDVIRYLMKEGSSEEDECPSFFHVSMLNCTCLKFVI